MAKVQLVPIKKITLTHPRTGREFEIYKTIYNPFKEAILESLKKNKTRTFTELTVDTVKIIRKKMPDFKRSIPWYTISILLDLQTRGMVETFIQKGKKMNRLIPAIKRG
jgi:hypothetical protein